MIDSLRINGLVQEHHHILCDDKVWLRFWISVRRVKKSRTFELRIYKEH